MGGLSADVRSELGEHLRALRQAQQLTLAALAADVGVTASALSQIERGKSEPSLGTLWRLGGALNASLFDFFARQEAATVDVTPAAARTVVEFERLRYEAVARSARRQIDLFFLRLRPGEGPVRELTTHAGEESGVVLEGSMDVIVAGRRHRLGPGDGIWFLSSQPHTFESVGDDECVSVWADTVVDPGVIRAGGSIFEAGGLRPARRRGARHDDALAVARALPIDAGWLRGVVERLASTGSSPLGFRTAGTPEDREVAAFAAGELAAAGLESVAIEEVAVDAWRFRGASVELGRARWAASSMGGVPPTPAGGVEGPLVDAGAGELRRLEGLDLRGAIALVDWRKRAVGLSDIGLELGLRGALAVVANCPEGGEFYQSEGTLGSFDGHWYAGAPPMVLIAKEDAVAVREALREGPQRARVTLDAEIAPGARGSNAVGHLPGERDGAPIVVGAHHDGWFRAAFDNATGVAAMLAIARALAETGHTMRHPICFTSRTAEEYGILDSEFDWCIGAWRQVTDSHPDWGEGAPFHLCVEASGHPDLRLLLETPVELAAWARRCARAGRREGWLTSGWRVAAPVTGTELWPFLVSGVPGVAAYTWEKAFMKTDYHTPRDVPGIVDFDHLARLTRFYAYLLLQADADPDAILDHGARAEDLRKAIAPLGRRAGGLRAAASRHAGAGGRRAFTSVGRGLLGMDAKGELAYPHAQAAEDVLRLEAALAALRGGDERAAARALGKVGDNAAAGQLSEAAFARRARRVRPDEVGPTWAAASHLTPSPELWAEIAALRAGEGQDWIEASLERHLERSNEELDRRLEAMTGALQDNTHEGTQ